MWADDTRSVVFLYTSLCYYPKLPDNNPRGAETCSRSVIDNRVFLNEMKRILCVLNYDL